MADDEDGENGGRHEDGRCDERAPREQRQPADAVTAGASTSENGAEADEQAGSGGEREVVRHCLRDAATGGGRPDKRRADQADKESQCLHGGAVRFGHDEAPHDAADAGDPAIEHHQQDGGGADQRTAGR